MHGIAYYDMDSGFIPESFTSSTGPNGVEQCLAKAREVVGDVTPDGIVAVNFTPDNSGTRAIKDMLEERGSDPVSQIAQMMD